LTAGIAKVPAATFCQAGFVLPPSACHVLRISVAAGVRPAASWSSIMIGLVRAAAGFLITSPLTLIASPPRGRAQAGVHGGLFGAPG
jgi:hypothetical protein